MYILHRTKLYMGEISACILRLPKNATKFARTLRNSTDKRLKHLTAEPLGGWKYLAFFSCDTLFWTQRITNIDNITNQNSALALFSICPSCYSGLTRLNRPLHHRHSCFPVVWLSSLLQPKIMVCHFIHSKHKIGS